MRRWNTVQIHTCHRAPWDSSGPSNLDSVVQSPFPRTSAILPRELFNVIHCSTCTYCGSYSIFVAYLGTEHETDSFFIPKGNLVTSFLETKCGISNVFESCQDCCRTIYRSLNSLPVRQSTNLKPSLWAIASSIFELTVEATIASLSGTLKSFDAAEWWPDKLTYPMVFQISCISQRHG